MKFQKTCILFLTLASVFQTADAAAMMRPGLWEHASAVKTQSGEMEESMRQMQQQMAAMPPEQRKMMESMMGSQGVSVTPKGSSVKTCVTPKEVELSTIPKTDPNCTQKITKQSGNTVSFTFNCKGQNPSSGEGTYTFQNSKAYTGKMTVRTKTGGKSETIQMNQSGKWVSDDCGKIKSAGQ